MNPNRFMTTENLITKSQLKSMQSEIWDWGLLTNCLVNCNKTKLQKEACAVVADLCPTCGYNSSPVIPFSFHRHSAYFLQDFS